MLTGTATHRAWTFQSTPSAWRETEYIGAGTQQLRHFNPLPPHGGRRVLSWFGSIEGDISIHSLRMEGDTTPDYIFRGLYISIHSLRMEGDVVLVNSGAVAFAFQSTPSAWRETFFALPTTFHPFKFQSTPSAWRETCCTTPVQKQSGHFNPLPPHGGRRVSRIFQVLMIYFNPLPPHGGRRNASSISDKRCSQFQSTPSAWRETIRENATVGRSCISIHSLRMEGDINTS